MAREKQHAAIGADSRLGVSTRKQEQNDGRLGEAEAEYEVRQQRSEKRVRLGVLVLGGGEFVVQGSGLAGEAVNRQCSQLTLGGPWL